MNDMQSHVGVSIINLRDLLGLEGLSIPDYQRPYKWTRKDVDQLVDDILANRWKSEYRLGTIVLHDGRLDFVGNSRGAKERGLFVVDGQQRTITLTLLVSALVNAGKLRMGVDVERLTLLAQRFSHTISKANIRRNFDALKARVKEFTELDVEFLLLRCRVVKIVLNDVSEAFQFFDSQNARGKDLNPHDLLKAFHLREMREESRDVVFRSVSAWENMDEDALLRLFGQCLFRVRNWASLKSARYFSKDDIDAFKGVNPGAREIFPFASICRLAHFCLDDFNRSAQGLIRGQMDFPFQLDQVILNGRRFFEFVEHYAEKSKNVGLVLKANSTEIYNAITTYDGRGRIGDCYVRNLFDCTCLYYWDKFGETKELPKVIRKIFFGAYSLRLRQARVTMATVDKEASSATGLICRIRQALRPIDVLSYEIPEISRIESTQTKALNELFIESGLVINEKEDER